MRSALVVVTSLAWFGCSGPTESHTFGASSTGSNSSGTQAIGAGSNTGASTNTGASNGTSATSSSSSTAATTSASTSTTSTGGATAASTSTSSTSSSGSTGSCCASLGCANLGESCDATLCQCVANATTSSTTTSGTSGGSSGTGVCSNAGCDVYASSDHDLYQVNPTTLATTQLCAFGGMLTSSSADNVTDIAITPGGTLYAITEKALYTVAIGSGSTCAATKVASLSTTSTRFVCLAFTVGDNLLASDEAGNVYNIVASTGVVTKVGTFGGTLSCSGDMVTIDDANQTIYASAYDSSCSGSSCTDKLVTLAPPGFSATVIGDLGYSKVYGLGYWAGNLYGFSSAGQVLSIDPTTAASTLVTTISGTSFSGGATTPLAPVITH